MRFGKEARQLLVVVTVLALLSLGHLPWTQQSLAQRLSDSFYLFLGGRLARVQEGAQADPVRAALLGENERLRELLSLQQRLPGEVRAAEVTRREPNLWWSELEVELPVSGSAPPVSSALVLTGDGLIGTLSADRLVLTETDSGRVARGRVTLLSAAGQQLSVVAGPGNQPFLLEGRGGASLALRPVSGGAEKEILPGDTVLTSGLGQLYRSRGLRVAQVEEDTRHARFVALSSTPTQVLLWWR